MSQPEYQFIKCIAIEKSKYSFSNFGFSLKDSIESELRRFLDSIFKSFLAVAYFELLLSLSVIKTSFQGRTVVNETRAGLVNIIN
jgi:hypothetical protein